MKLQGEVEEALPGALSFLIQTFHRPGGDLQQLTELRFRFSHSESFHYFRRQVFLEISLNIEGFPPAVDYLDAWLAGFLAGPAVFKGNRPAEPGTAPLARIVFIHFSLLRNFNKNSDVQHRT